MESDSAAAASASSSLPDLTELFIDAPTAAPTAAQIAASAAAPVVVIKQPNLDISQMFERHKQLIIDFLSIYIMFKQRDATVYSEYHTTQIDEIGINLKSDLIKSYREYIEPFLQQQSDNYLQELKLRIVDITIEYIERVVRQIVYMGKDRPIQRPPVPIAVPENVSSFSVRGASIDLKKISWTRSVFINDYIKKNVGNSLTFDQVVRLINAGHFESDCLRFIRLIAYLKRMQVDVRSVERFSYTLHDFSDIEDTANYKILCASSGIEVLFQKLGDKTIQLTPDRDINVYNTDGAQWLISINDHPDLWFGFTREGIKAFNKNDWTVFALNAFKQEINTKMDYYERIFTEQERNLQKSEIPLHRISKQIRIKVVESFKSVIDRGLVQLLDASWNAYTLNELKLINYNGNLNYKVGDELQIVTAPDTHIKLVGKVGVVSKVVKTADGSKRYELKTKTGQNIASFLEKRLIVFKIYEGAVSKASPGGYYSSSFIHHCY